jgi:hypothetical protein
MNPERDVAEHSTSGPAIGASVIQPYSTPPITYQYNREIELGFFSPELRFRMQFLHTTFSLDARPGHVVPAWNLFINSAW